MFEFISYKNLSEKAQQRIVLDLAKAIGHDPSQEEIKELTNGMLYDKYGNLL